MKTYLLKSILTVLALLMSANSFSQTVTNAASNSTIVNGMTFDYSIGEMAIISTEKGSNLIVTQGFLQPNQISVPNSGLNSLTHRIEVYPNPTQNHLTIETNEVIRGSMAWQLLDVSGKVILKGNEQLAVGNNKYILDISSIAVGSYYLLVSQTNNLRNSKSLSFKIQKAN